jgi:glycine/D-amino acid oxidase-like deaminating enzyme
MTPPTPPQPTHDGPLGAPFTADAKLQPYWWETTPRPTLPSLPAPAEVDVAVIGSGYTGLQAALQTARGGRHTAVFDAEDAGWGCSSRNGGQVSTSVKPTLDTLTRRHGQQKAQDILAEGRQSLAYLGEFVQRESIDCSFGNNFSSGFFNVRLEFHLKTQNSKDGFAKRIG